SHGFVSPSIRPRRDGGKAGLRFTRAPRSSLAVVVRRFRRRLELAVGLVEQILRLRRVAVHVPFVRLLRSDDAVVGLVGEPLRRGDVRMTPAADVAYRLRSERGGGDQRQRGGRNVPCELLHVRLPRWCGCHGRRTVAPSWRRESSAAALQVPASSSFGRCGGSCAGWPDGGSAA